MQAIQKFPHKCMRFRKQHRPEKSDGAIEEPPKKVNKSGEGLLKECTISGNFRV